MPTFYQLMILSESTKNCISAASSITPEFKLILDQPSLSANIKIIYHVLQKMGCMVSVAAALFAFLVTRHQIMRNSKNPGNV